MWTRWRLIAGTMLSVVSLPALAGETPRFHILSASLSDRLVKTTPKLRASFSGVGLYRRKDGRTGGTAFLVHDQQHPERAVVMTANHVALFERDRVAGDEVLFYPDGADAPPVSARVLRVIEHDAKIDYVRLEVDLPPSLRKLPCTRLSTSAAKSLEDGQRLYNPSFPRIWADEKGVVGQGLVSGPTHRAAYQAALAGTITPKMLQVGSAQGFTIEGFEVASLPQQNGSSGSPVFDTVTHRFIGMLTAGGGIDTAMIRPAAVIAQDIAKKHKGGRSR